MNQQMLKDNEKEFNILVVEDNEGDAELLMHALKKSHRTLKVSLVRDGMEAMNFLMRDGKYENAPRPDIIILDLNLPKKDGREVLKEIKSDDILKSVPVIVMSMSQSEADVNETYKLHANCYIPKPLEYDQFIREVRLIEDFWFSTARLPGGNYL